MKALSRRDGDPEFLSTLERGLCVLRAFDETRPEMQLSEVASVTGLNPAVVRRCLNTLVKLGYVAQHGRRFLLSPEVLVFGSAFLASMNLEEVAAPALQTVRDSTGDSSSLAVLSGDDVLYVLHVSTNRTFRMRAGVGTRFPIYATSLGRILLSHQGEEEIEKYLERAKFEKLTEHTVTSSSALRKLLKDARKQGYASVQDELDYGIVSVAVPVFMGAGQVVAAINCSTSTTRVSSDELIKTRVPVLKEAAQKIGAALDRWPYLLHSLKHE